MAGLDIKQAFKIDAAKILAKLHCKARTAQPKCVFFNSGVVDDNKGLKPEDCENSSITFATDQKTYELAVVAPEQQAECRLKHTVQEIMDKLKAPEAGEDAKATENPDEGKEGRVDESGSFMRFLRRGDAPPVKPGDQALLDPFIEPKDATDEVKKMVKENNEALAKAVEDYKAVLVRYLQDYMKLFAGEDEAKKITDRQAAVVYLPEGSDPEKMEYKDGAITGVDDDARAKNRMD